MPAEVYSKDIENALYVLKKSGIILYPTDTIWGIGCDATNEDAIQKIYKLKKRSNSKALVILVSNESEIARYVYQPDKYLLDYLKSTTKPTTVIYENAINLPSSLLGEDNTIAIRIVKDPFCKELIGMFKGAVVSTSANLSEEPTPKYFGEISDVIKKGVDYIVKYRQEDTSSHQPSSIIKSKGDGGIEIIR